MEVVRGECSSSMGALKKISAIIWNATKWNELVDLSGVNFAGRATTQHFTDQDIFFLWSGDLVPNLPDLPCHSQRVERSVKMVSDASHTVFGEENKHKVTLPKLLSWKMRSNAVLKITIIKFTMNCITKLKSLKKHVVFTLLFFVIFITHNLLHISLAIFCATFNCSAFEWHRWYCFFRKNIAKNTSPKTIKNVALRRKLFCSYLLCSYKYVLAFVIKHKQYFMCSTVCMQYFLKNSSWIAFDIVQNIELLIVLESK